MSNQAVLDFVAASLPANVVAGRTVLEVGSYDWQEFSTRQIVEPLNPKSYVGVDIEAGPGVDDVCDVAHLVDRFGENAFDVVISTETLEHVEDWRRAVSQLKKVLASGGTLVVTTRSRGFHLHGYPDDWWRFEREDFAHIFSDLDGLTLATDSLSPGIFATGVKPLDFHEVDLQPLRMYSVAFGRRIAGSNAWANAVGRHAVRAVLKSKTGLRAVLPDSVIRRIQRRGT